MTNERVGFLKYQVWQFPQKTLKEEPKLEKSVWSDLKAYTKPKRSVIMWKD